MRPQKTTLTAAMKNKNPSTPVGGESQGISKLPIKN
jgi:hypothetical protein